MSDKISIILPIYNAGSYLESALNSIINQSWGLENLEVIMIDDCSTDNSCKIIQDYANKFDNFIDIYLDENSGGAGKPRNIGLKYATSDYILFLDPDDELMPNICEDLFNELKNKNADIVTANAICMFKDNEIIDINYREKYYEIVPNKDLELFKPFRVWGTLFKKSFIDENDIKFIDVSTNEDTYFVYNCFFKANKIIYLNDYIGVKHYERDVSEFISLTHNFSKNHIIGTIDAFKQILILIYTLDPINDYTYDPFILNIYGRFEVKWIMSKEDKFEIFEKILEYESISKYSLNLPFHCKIMNFLLTHRLFNFLIIFQSIFSSCIQINFIQSKIIKKRKLKYTI